MQLDPDEVAVICRKCNGYLWSTSSTTSLASDQSVLVDCPYKCAPDGAGGETMEIPPNSQPYGRS